MGYLLVLHHLSCNLLGYADFDVQVYAVLGRKALNSKGHTGTPKK